MLCHLTVLEKKKTSFTAFGADVFVSARSFLNKMSFAVPSKYSGWKAKKKRENTAWKIIFVASQGQSNPAFPEALNLASAREAAISKRYLWACCQKHFRIAGSAFIYYWPILTNITCYRHRKKPKKCVRAKKKYLFRYANLCDIRWLYIKASRHEIRCVLLHFFGQTRSYGVFMTRFVRLRAMCTFYFGIMTTFRWPLIRSRIYQAYTSAKRAKTRISTTTTYTNGSFFLAQRRLFVLSQAPSKWFMRGRKQTNDSRKAHLSPAQ